MYADISSRRNYAFVAEWFKAADLRHTLQAAGESCLKTSAGEILVGSNPTECTIYLLLPLVGLFCSLCNHMSRDGEWDVFGFVLLGDNAPLEYPLLKDQAVDQSLMLFLD